MFTLTKLKQEKEFIADMGEIIDTFKVAALIQFRIFQGRKHTDNNFLEELERCFDLLRLFPSKDKKTSSSLSQRTIVAITSDEGFLGELNTLIINAALDRRSSAEDRIIVLGDVGARYMENIKQPFVYFSGVSDDLDYGYVERLRRYLLSGFDEHFAALDVVYPRFISLTEQRITTIHLLPYSPEAGRSSTGIRREEIMFGSSLKNLIRSIEGLLLGFRLSEIFSSAKQSEYAARIMHLEGSSEEISHLRQRLNLSYFKQVHSLSDKSIREISAAKVMLRKGNVRYRNV
ncbi:MAG: F0F1 ATP synthase subunit gamma [Candidatus Omnitrophota bacterium]